MGRRCVSCVLAVIGYAAVTVWATWPLARDASDRVATVGGLGMSDVLQIASILAWDVHALGSPSATLVARPVFHPVPDAGVGADLLLGQVPLFAPVWLATQNPVLALNVVVLGSFVLSALAMHVYLVWLTGRLLPAVAGAILFAFTPWRHAGVSNPHLLTVQYLPLVLLGLQALWEDGRPRWAIVLAGALALQALSSFYHGYAAFALAGIAVLGLAATRGRPADWRWVLAALLAPLLLVVVASAPYRRWLDRWPWPPAEPGLEAFVSGLVQGPLHLAAVWLGWPAVAAGLGGLLALIASWGRSRREVRAAAVVLVVATVAGVSLAAGSPGLVAGWVAPFAWLRELVPGVERMRSALRFALLASVGLGGLAGLGLAAIGARWGRAFGSLVAAAAIVTALLDFARTSLTLVRVPTEADLPPAYAWLAAHGERGPLLELPTHLDPNGDSAAGRAQYFAIFHGLPLVNGYLGYRPREHELVVALSQQLPEADALHRLGQLTGVRWLLVHGEPSTTRARGWEALPGVRHVDTFAGEGGPDRLYTVLDAPTARPWWRARDVTLEGNPVAPDAAVAGVVEVHGLPEVLEAAGDSRVEITVRNPSAGLWPATAVDPADRATLHATWESSRGAAPRGREEIPIPADVPAGATARFAAWLRHPERSGRWTLHVELGRAGVGGGQWQQAVDVVPGPRD